MCCTEQVTTATPTFIAEIDHCGSTIRTSEAWQCHNESAPPEWTAPEFDASNWPHATDGGANGSPPWGSRPQISGQAHWIWSPAVNTTLLCRFVSGADRWLDCPAAARQYTHEYPVVEDWLRHQASPFVSVSLSLGLSVSVSLPVSLCLWLTLMLHGAGFSQPLCTLSLPWASGWFHMEIRALHGRRH